MGVSPATFQSAGQISQHYIPGAYSRRNFIANEGGGVSAGNVAILGYSELAEPNKLLVFSSANEARAALMSGEGLDAVVQAFSPGDGITPQEIGFIRVNPGTQSSRVIQKSAVTTFTLNSFSYGVPMNQIRLKFSAGTLAGTYKLETEYRGETEEEDNIGQETLSIQYVGTGSAATMTIDSTTLATTVTGGPGSEDLSITLADYPTISELVEYINNLSVYTASILAGDVLDSSSELDEVTAVDILTTAYTADSNYQAIYEALVANSFIGSVTKAAVAREVPDLDGDYVYFSGATSGAYTVTEFTASLVVAEGEDIQFLATPSTDASVHTLFRNHCDTMNSVTGRKERQAFLGGALGETVSQVVARAAALNREHTVICSPGYKAYDDNGDIVDYAPSYYACKQAGHFSALALNNPTTHKGVDILEWETNYLDSDLRTLIRGGVTAGGKDQDGSYITIRSITTYQAASLQQNEVSIVRETYYQDRDLRRRQETAFVGRPGVGQDLLASADSIFERAIRDWDGLGIIVPYNGKFYTGYTRRLEGDQLIVEYTTYNTAPVNFVFTTHSIAVPVAS